MSAPDFAAIIDAEINDWDAHANARMVLAAKVSELCRACGGGGLVPQCHPEHDAQGEDCGCPANFMPCPDCPTIAKLLAIGAAVMSAERRTDPTFDTGTWGTVINGEFVWSADTLEALRAVQP